MPKGSFVIILTILFLSLTIPAVAAKKDDSTRTTTTTTNSKNPFERPPFSTKHQECGVYLAPSTIPGAGLGMFAGNIEYNPGDIVTDSDLVVPVFELGWHNGHDDNLFFLWDEYVWTATMFPGMEYETEETENIHVCSGGMGAAVNCMLPLVNVEDEDVSYAMSMSGVNSSHSPGAGAFTPYYGRKFQATKKIEAGAELYASYGESYFSTRNAYSNVPLAKNYLQANRLLKKFRMISERTRNKNILSSKPETIKISNDDSNYDEGSANKDSSANSVQTVTESVLEDLWGLIKEIPESLGVSSRTWHALPSNYTEIPRILESGGTSMQHYNASIRSLEWLEEYGQCMDNIRDGISTVPHAGRGAFATRFIPKGGLVAPAPLIHIGNRSILTMYDSIEEIDEKGKATMSRDLSKPIHHQLLLNYCFGHGESDLLLCPYGLLTALINHGHGEKANTKIQWSKRMRHPEWKQQSVKSFAKKKHTGLSFDFVATRDIQKGEEILLDYGDEWEEAWQEHMKSFGTPRLGYMPGFELNNMADLRIPTLDEVSFDAEGVHTYCRHEYLAMDGLLPVEGFQQDDSSPCRVVKRNHDNSYVAELWDVVFGEWDSIKDHDVVGILFDVPRDAFYFLDTPYSRDHHKPWSFRHDMRIPNEIFPESWKRQTFKASQKDKEL